ncbi:MAG: alpha/beta fold hydrolase [Acidobacteria bacterium]|nr:alpha/beta fold hydrolase [Acidobacteriota bacterium]
MKEFKFRDYSVKYIDEGSGEPMVFLHNGGNDHQIWGRQIEHFKKTNRVLALDYLGFGESDKPRIELTLPLYSEMVGEFIDQLKLAPVTLVGNCMGSAMSFDYTLHNPGKVKRLILFNIASEKHLLAGPLGKVYQTFPAAICCAESPRSRSTSSESHARRPTNCFARSMAKSGSTIRNLPTIFIISTTKKGSRAHSMSRSRISTHSIRPIISCCRRTFLRFA